MYAEGPVRRTLLWQKPRPSAGWVAVLSVVACMLVSGLYWGDIWGLSERLAASGASVFDRREYWRLLTTMLVHADIRHLASNSVALALGVWLVYGYFGPGAYPTLGVAAGVAVNVVALQTYPPDVRLVGASGLVYVLAGWWLTGYFLIERQRSIRQRLLRCTGFSLVLLLPASVDPSVSYRSHAIGGAVGVAAMILWFVLWRDTIRAAEVRDGPVFTPPTEEDEQPGPPRSGPHTIH